MKSKADPDYPWLVSRYTAEFRYEPVMRCSSFESACRLTQSLVWLAKHSNPAESIVQRGYPHVD